jgi:phospholipase C
MIHRAGPVRCFVGSFSLTLTLIGCGYVSSHPGSETSSTPTSGDIQHIVVIFQENVSFDHYFGTYPNALNLPGESSFIALPATPAVDGLSQALLLNNPNWKNAANGRGDQSLPFAPSNAATADQDHDYQAEQRAFDAGGMDLFPLSVGAADGPGTWGAVSPPPPA